MTRIALFLVGCLTLSGLLSEGQAAGEWTSSEGEEFDGRLIGFDFESKRALFETAEGKRSEVSTRDLSQSSRWRLLLSPTFSRSFPEDDWTQEQRYYLLLATLGISLPLLASFYLCALILFKNGNPLRAISGWIGSVLLGGFFGTFYLILSAKNPSTATGVLVFGGSVSLGVLSLYVSVIYSTSFINGLKLLVLHLFGAFLILAVSLLVLQRVSLAFDLSPLIDARVMIPTGILSDN